MQHKPIWNSPLVSWAVLCGTSKCSRMKKSSRVGGGRYGQGPKRPKGRRKSMWWSANWMESFFSVSSSLDVRSLLLGPFIILPPNVNKRQRQTSEETWYLHNGNRFLFDETAAGGFPPCGTLIIEPHLAANEKGEERDTVIILKNMST